MILAFDANSMICQLWHAQAGIGVLPTVLSRMNALVDRLNPSHIVACFDRRSFRYDVFPEYKAKRKEKPESLVRDLSDAPVYLSRLATICEQDGFEADDCLASIAAVGQRIKQKTVIASPDKDLRQCLVEGQVTILKSFTLRGDEVVELDWYTADRLKKEHGLTPSQWPDYQALVGDSTDGVPGCKGWGPVLAERAMKQFGSLQAVIDNPLGLKMSANQAVAMMKFKGKMAEMMLKLVTLRTDVAAAVDALR